MGKLSICFLFTVFTVSFLFHIVPISSQEVENEKEFDYQNPNKWGDIHPEWKECATGKMQSPIDLLDERVTQVPNSGMLKRNYKPANASLENRGHDMMLKWGDEGAGTLEVNGAKYVLKQCHWHSPSEHTVKGKRYDLELHMVHESKDGKYAVVGVLYKIGRPDSFLSSLTEKLKEVAGIKEEKMEIGIVNPMDIKMDASKYYSYIGSLTVPPCTENIQWMVVMKVRCVTEDQIKLLRVAVHDKSDSNARPIQHSNGRVVQLCGITT